MKNLIIFLDKWSGRIALPLIFVVFFKTCTTNGKVEKVEENLTNEIHKTDSGLKYKMVSKEDIQRMLTIEGLKVEKRMIQSTDRKILDVNRQSEIDKEIEKLEKK